ncbi:MAG: hypothetical protein IAG13_26275 [Deltaproteobacteria bacterium]|nr:hypothetical protein [Nannocystaceae bacterium]
MVWMLAFAAPALASTGKPEGFAVEQASSQIVLGKVTLRYEPELADDAEMLAQSIPQWWSEIERPLARDVDDRVRITFVNHSGRVAEATGMPQWVAGVARPEAGDIVIARHAPDGSRTDLERLLKHEMAHVILHRATGGAELPRWFHEGMAESVTGGISLTRAQTLAAAVFGPGVPDLAKLEQHFRGSDGADAAVAYAAARDLVEFLRSRDAQGAQGASMRQLLAELRRGTDFEAAFVRAYDASLPDLVGQWRGGLRGRFVWYPMIASGGVPFALLMPLVFAAWLRRRRELARGWARLEREDEIERAAMAGGAFGMA